MSAAAADAIQQCRRLAWAFLLLEDDLAKAWSAERDEQRRLIWKARKLLNGLPSVADAIAAQIEEIDRPAPSFEEMKEAAQLALEEEAIMRFMSSPGYEEALDRWLEAWRAVLLLPPEQQRSPGNILRYYRPAENDAGGRRLKLVT